MSLRIIIEEKYKNSIKARNTKDAQVLRLIKSAIKDKDIENRTKKSEEINDTQIMLLLQNLIKQRNDSIDSFKLASRNDLVQNEQYEINLIKKFLPKQLSFEETDNIIKKIINEDNLSSIKDMGLLMNILKKKYSGSINMATAGKIAKSLLVS